MIKNNRPSRKSQFKQGYYPINECKKYIGKGPIIYRSSWEFKFCKYCERTPEISHWISEPLEIKYLNSLDGKFHRYYPDFLIKTNEGKTFLIEIKPSSQLKEPNPPKRKTKKSIKNYEYSLRMYIVNMCKIKYAKEFCESRGIGYKIITEDFFKTV